jgi:hypothetical protein
MRLKLAVALIAALAMTAGWPEPPLAEAQDASGISISLWHTGLMPPQQGSDIHMFWARVDMSTGPDLTNLTIVTNCGDIVFEDHVFNGSTAARDATTALQVNSDLSCPKFLVVRAHGRLGYETVDLTDSLTLETTTIIPMELVTASTSQRGGNQQGGPAASQQGESACESKQTPAGYIEGRYQGQECVDYCHLTVKLDSGVDLTGYASDDVQNFNAPIGTRVRLDVSDVQFYDEDFTNPCVRDRLFTSIERVR